MATDDISPEMALGVGTMSAALSSGTFIRVTAVSISTPLIIAGSICAAYVFRNRLKRGWWRRLRVRTLGGVTTLERKLSYNCAMCQYSMEAREEVLTLSCNHVFHCGESDKCKGSIDKWLRTQPTMFCPVCRKTPRLVLPWKAPPPESPAASSADQELVEVGPLVRLV